MGAAAARCHISQRQVSLPYSWIHSHNESLQRTWNLRRRRTAIYYDSLRRQKFGQVKRSSKEARF